MKKQKFEPGDLVYDAKMDMLLIVRYPELYNDSNVAVCQFREVTYHNNFINYPILKSDLTLIEKGAFKNG